MTLVTEKLDTVEDINHEDIPLQSSDEQGQALEVSKEKQELAPIDKTIQVEVAKFNLPRAAIAALKEAYKDLPERAKTGDKAAIKQLEEAHRNTRKKRTAVETTRKKIKSDFITVGRAIDKEAKELTELLEEIELPLEEAIEEKEKAVQAAKDALEKAEQEKLQGRVADLLGNGMAFTGAYYTIGETISMDVVTLKGMPDEAFEELKARVIKENDILLAAVAEKERIKRENDEALEKQRKLNETEQERLRLANASLIESQNELKRQQDEMKKELIGMRRGKLVQLGFSINLDESMSFNARTSATEIEKISVPYERIESAGWNEFFPGIADMVKSLNLRAENYAAEAKAAVEKENKLQDRYLRRVANLEIRFQMEFEVSDSGMGEFNGRYVREFPLISESIYASKQDILTMEDSEWNNIVDVDLTAGFNEYTAAEKIEADRIKQLADAEAEEDRQAQLTDAVKMLEYGQKLAAIASPEVKDGYMNDILFEVTELLARILEFGKLVEAETRPATE